MKRIWFLLLVPGILGVLLKIILERGLKLDELLIELAILPEKYPPDNE